LFAGTPSDSDDGLGDPYVEIAWARYFRGSRFAGAYPIPEGLSILRLGFGVVIPAGTYDAADLLMPGAQPRPPQSLATFDLHAGSLHLPRQRADSLAPTEAGIQRQFLLEPNLP
jgi:hypothetical protein